MGYDSERKEQDMARHLSDGTIAIKRNVPALEIANLQKVYGTHRNPVRALDGLDLAIMPGEFVAIMGPSGSGKSTLLNCIATIDQPTAGSISIAGNDVSRLSRGKLADFRRTQLGFIFQDSNLLDTLTGRENIALPLTIGRMQPERIKVDVESVAQALGVSDVLEQYPYQMSGGQRQRMAAARALVTRPHLVLADEPTGALDTKNSRILLESMEKLNRAQHATILMVTHDEVAASYCQRVVFIRDGRLFTELRRGSSTRQQLFERIMQAVALEGGVDHAR